jgi:MYXO-CTERM domain-containing protein
MKNVLALLAVAGMAAGANAAIAIQASSVAFVDISTSGTSIGTISDDSETNLAGATHGWTGNGLFAGGVSIRIGNNGAIVWGNSATDTFAGATEIGYYNAGPLNSTSPAGSQTSIAGMTATNTGQSGNGGGIRQFVAPLWDDYTPVSSTVTSIRWQVIAGDLIIQWNRQDAFAATGSGDVTFQAIFRGGVSIASGASLVDFVYQDTLFQANQYQNDGGSATIGYKNWGLNAAANDVEFGIGGGGASATSDPSFASGTGRQAKVVGWAANGGTVGAPNSVSIIPTPGVLALAGMGGLLAARRRRA